MAFIPETPGSESPDPADRPAEPTVLVVDDEEGMRSFLTRTLALRGWQVEAAASASGSHSIRASALSKQVSPPPLTLGQKSPSDDLLTALIRGVIP